MEKNFFSDMPLHKFSLWEDMKKKHRVFSFNLELTARCNNNCRHCYVNLPVQDKDAASRELSVTEIERIADEAIEMGALWCLLTGGEPLLRKDFSDIYIMLKKKGLLLSVFTNACLITQEHMDLFRQYPPRDIEVTVYGVTEKTYEDVTRVPGSFNAFTRGLDLLLKNNIKVRFKAMALRSNVSELDKIADFCRERTKDYFRFDPFLHLRFDGDAVRNEEIKAERLSAAEIAKLEKDDDERFMSLEKNCDKLIVKDISERECKHLFHCGAGNGSFTLGHNGLFRLCSSLTHPDCVYDLRKGSLKEAYSDFVAKVRSLESDRKEFIDKCHKCEIVNFCMWCPAHAYLECGEMDAVIDYFCEVASARYNNLKQSGEVR